MATCCLAREQLLSFTVSVSARCGGQHLAAAEEQAAGRRFPKRKEAVVVGFLFFSQLFTGAQKTGKPVFSWHTRIPHASELDDSRGRREGPSRLQRDEV